MTIALPERLEVALKAHANARGISPYLYVLDVLERDLGQLEEPEAAKAFKPAFGILAKYGSAPSAEEIDANRAEMLRNFGEDF